MMSSLALPQVQPMLRARLPKAKCRKLEIPKQDFFHEAKYLIAQHYERIKENEVQETSIDVFKNTYHKTNFIRYLPPKFKKTETPDVAPKHRAVLRGISPPRNLSPKGYFKKPNVFTLKERYQTVDLFKKEQVKLRKIMTDIESVSKKMEKEKQQDLRKPRVLRPSHALVTCPNVLLQSGTSAEGTPRETERLVYDWRGIISASPFHLPEDQKVSDSSAMFQDYFMNLLRRKKVLPIEPDTKPDRMKTIASRTDRLDSKVRRIGPHIEIFQYFRGSMKPIITKKVIKTVITVQAAVRGWLERRRIKRVATKALYHGPDLKSVINMYLRQIHRVRHQLGLWRTRQILNFAELEEWMDRKKFYETMFAKREDWQGLQKSELLKYFNDCGHYPTQKQIDYYWEKFTQDRPRKHSEIIKKSQVMEMLFTIYPPAGAHVQQTAQLKSTWLRPIVNGEEGYKYIVNGHPILKRANIKVVGKLVARSIRERKMRG
ncbi:IQ domain-containing protein M isoform 2-T2 [Thomomys bottae]